MVNKKSSHIGGAIVAGIIGLMFLLVGIEGFRIGDTDVGYPGVILGSLSIAGSVFIFVMAYKKAKIRQQLYLSGTRVEGTVTDVGEVTIGLSRITDHRIHFEYKDAKGEKTYHGDSGSLRHKPSVSKGDTVEILIDSENPENYELVVENIPHEKNSWFRFKM